MLTKNNNNKIENGSITQTSNEIYKIIRRHLIEYNKVDARKLAKYLREEKGMTLEGIGRILGMSRQAVEKKYFSKEDDK